jgi:hypothetical protein
LPLASGWSDLAGWGLHPLESARLVTAHTSVTAAIVGARNPAEVDGCLAAASLELSETDLKEIADAIAGTGAGGGPTLPRRQA